MNYTENNVQFNNVKQSNVYVGVNGPLTSKSSYRLDDNGNIEHREGDYLVNAIDIHWNGAQLENVQGENIPTEITSTADLIKIIDNAYATIAVLSNTIVELETQLNQDLSQLDDKYNEIATNLETLANNI